MGFTVTNYPYSVTFLCVLNRRSPLNMPEEATM